MQDPGFVRRIFSEIADHYVLTNHVLSLGTDILWRRKLVRGVREKSPKLVLDVATGSGDVASEIRKQCPNTETIGADFCRPMLGHARRAGLTNLLVADGLCLPFGNDSFDAVTVAFGLRNMASWKDALIEWHRVLKPAGSLHVLDFAQPTWQPLRGAYLFYMHRVLPHLAGLLTKRRRAFDYLSASIDLFPQGKAMCHLIREAGFQGVGTQTLYGGIVAIYVGVK